ncbi:hypothetical protein HB852_00690 [Listeria grandensis]|uniref:hypothetical protein n=1 Tax=Listeria grandensis TaxID=1494963 RepID=UPI0016246948|nr:hypothetical protein [Listeria grandensis]MBC1473133.1 hypothetical protein [Listeria grandensis]
MEKIHRGNGFVVIEKEDEYQISWSQGPYEQPVFYTISKENADRAFKSPQDAYKVMIYAETGQWPNLDEEKKNKDSALIKKFPELLIRIPSNQELFTEDELKELMPLARKALEQD